MRSTSQRTFKSIGVPVLVLMVALLAVTLMRIYGSPWSPSDDTSPRTEKPVVQIDDSAKSLAGEWHQTEGPDGVVMSASITEGSIEINMKLGKSNGTYWRGTFETDKKDDSQFTVLSLADQNVLSQELLASTDETKVFSYKDGEITFPFTMMKVHTTIRLERNK